MTGKKIRLVVIGCGFWSRYQTAAWGEMENVELVAVCDRNEDHAKEMAAQFDVSYFVDAEKMLSVVTPDLVDIITDVHSHAPLVHLAARHRVAVICQKPMAPDFQTAGEMVSACDSARVPFFVHENFRWQAPLRRTKEILDSGIIGNPFKARISFCSAFPVFDNQPFLKDLKQFIIADVGSHILDVVRFLLGEVRSLYCRIKSVNPGIRGEDVANMLLEMDSGVHCMVEMSYASRLEKEVFPQTLVQLEGELGTISLEADFVIKVTTRSGTTIEHAAPKVYTWSNPDYAIIHSSMVDINRDFCTALMAGITPETSGTDNLETVRLVYAAYESAEKDRVIRVDEFFK